jgi:ring-1,2-phenylacetyl-CoA epoxidase subunit PaaD
VVSEAAVWAALAEVPDPEIPTVSVVDLGVIRGVQVEGKRLTVEMLPTFVGCPAIEIMRAQIGERLAPLADEVVVKLSFAEPWTSDRISAEGREKLRGSGFAPPAGIGLADELAMMPIAICPYCGSRNTALENPFGPTLCRAIYHCADCRQPFEQFKRV